MPTIVEAIGKDLKVWGRSSDGKKYCKSIKDFSPYFFIPCSENTGWKSIDGDNVRKLVVNHPGEVPTLRGKYKKTFLADVTYTNRFLIDSFDKLEEEPIRCLWLDLECKKGPKGQFPVAALAESPITVIGCWDSFIKRYVQFFFCPSMKKTMGTFTSYSDRSIYCYDTEEEMLRKFIEFVKDTDPDIILGWNSWGFDFPYIFNRMKKLGIDPNELSPLGEVGEKFNPYCRGRVLLDYLRLYENVQDTSKSSFALDYILQEELGEGKVKLEGDMDEVYSKDPQAYLDYNLRDIQGMLELEQKLELIPYYDELRRLTKANWDDLLYDSRLLDFFLINFCNKKKLVLPTKEKKEGSVQKGAYRENFTGKGGIFKNTIVQDLVSMYPSLIVAFNVGIETLDKNGEIKLSNGTNFTIKKESVISQSLKELLFERKKWKGKMKEVDRGSKEYKIYRQRQYSLKILANAFYGNFGYKGGRIYSPECLGAVTFLGRELLKHCQKVVENSGFSLLYEDTDGLHIQIDKDSIDEIVSEGKKLQEKLNNSFDDFVRRFGLVKNEYLQIAFEEIYDKIFFDKVKLRYAGHLCWKDGGKVDEYNIKGFETRRSNNSRLGRKLQRKVFEIILREEEPKEKVFSYIRQVMKEMLEGKFSIDDISIPVGVGENPYLYGKNRCDGSRGGIPPQIRGVIHSNKFHDENISMGDKIKYIYVRNCPPEVTKTDVISWKNKFPQGYEINWDEMVRQNIYLKVERIFSCLDWNIEELRGQKKLGDYFL